MKNKRTLNFGDRVLAPEATIKDAIECIENNIMKIVFVTDQESRLIGSVTDGDVRRAILKGTPIETRISFIMNQSPAFSYIGDTQENIQKMMREKDHRFIPVLNKTRQIERVDTLNDEIKKNKKKNWVFLMAGGFGKRLRPYTDDIPKPMLTVGDKPILENILESFISCGFEKFFISLHYKGSFIRDYFGDGSKWNVDIRYTEEKTPLGTAGALSLIPEQLSVPILVMNGDILTKINFDNLLDFHFSTNSTATLCVREHIIQVPYGTVNVEKSKVVNLVEKPSISFFVNAGIYVLEPHAVAQIKKNSYCDMPHLLNVLKENQKTVSAFPIHEYWVDMEK